MNKGQSLIHMVIGIGAGLATFFVGWDGWLSNAVISQGNEASAIVQWQKDADKKLDWLVERNGANPEAIISRNSTTTQ